MRRILWVLMLGFFYKAAWAQGQVGHSPTPSWVKAEATLGTGNAEGKGGFRYLLFEKQFHLPNATVYYHFQYQLTSTDAVQEHSDITVSFDPSFQELTFHEVHIIRDGKKLNQLKIGDVELLRRESASDRSLYDGNLTAMIHLKDVRKKDIVVYNYSIKGFNPAYDRHFSTNLYHAYSVPVEQFHYRLLTDESNPVYFKKLNHQEEPRVKTFDNLKEYTWNHKQVPAILLDNRISPWEAPYPITSISTLKDWGDVVEWALPLYGYNQVPNVKINPKSGSKEDKVNALIELVQDEVRYLGLENGIGAYKPNSPKQIWDQKFGDCKDKSLLLVALLRREGVNAYPMLVNSEYRHNTGIFQPSPIAFDHCVVMYELEGNNYFVDPTFSNQKGMLSNRYFPNYGLGLPIKKGNTELIRLPTAEAPQTKIMESIIVDEIGGSASFRIETTYTGYKADDIRAYFEGNSRDQIQREYRNFYNNLYQGIEADGEPTLTEYSEGGKSQVRTFEQYTIPEFWTKNDDGEMLLAKVYPLVLESQTNYPKSPERVYPYYLGPRFHFEQETNIYLPEDWNVSPTEKIVERDELYYHSKVKGNGKRVTVSYLFEQRAEEVAAEKTNELIKDYESIENDWMFSLTHQPGLEGFKIDPWVLSFAILLLVVGIYTGKTIYTKYDPIAWKYAENKTIGGWLVLPAIGLTLTPIMLISEIISTEYFNSNIWTMVSLQGFKSLMVFSFMANFLLLIYALIVLIHFYKRRTSLPRLITIFYAVNLLIVIVDHYLAEEILLQSSAETDYRDLSRAVMSAFIWIPYFNIAERVKSTFCNTYKRGV